MTGSTTSCRAIARSAAITLPRNRRVSATVSTVFNPNSGYNPTNIPTENPNATAA